MNKLYFQQETGGTAELIKRLIGAQKGVLNFFKQHLLFCCLFKWSKKRQGGNFRGNILLWSIKDKPQVIFFAKFKKLTKSDRESLIML